MCMITCNLRNFSPAANISSQTHRPLNFAGHDLAAHGVTFASKRCHRPGRGVQGCKHDRDRSSIASSKNQIEAQGVASPTGSELHLQHAQDALRKQQQQNRVPVPLPLAKSLVETAMLAAVSGLAFTLATLLGLESYLGYFLPMPVIVAAMRSGPAAGRKTMTATCFLLLLLLGPIRAVTYFFMHGLLAVSLGALWHWRAHWGITLVTGAITRLLGTLGYLIVTSWTLNEDLFSLLLANVYSLLDRIAGGSGTPSPAVVAVVVGCLFAVNCILYVCVMHAVYIPLLQGMGYRTSELPQFVQRIIARRSGQIATQ
ncbi:hypothetical protein WJX79_000296 [Trebouxia sp. C0005]